MTRKILKKLIAETRRVRHVAALELSAIPVIGQTTQQQIYDMYRLGGIVTTCDDLIKFHDRLREESENADFVRKMSVHCGR